MYSVLAKYADMYIFKNQTSFFELWELIQLQSNIEKISSNSSKTSANAGPRHLHTLTSSGHISQAARGADDDSEGKDLSEAEFQGPGREKASIGDWRGKRRHRPCFIVMASFALLPLTMLD